MGVGGYNKCSKYAVGMFSSNSSNYVCFVNVGTYCDVEIAIANTHSICTHSHSIITHVCM